MNPQPKPQKKIKNETHEARTKASQSDLDRRDERTKQNQMNPQAKPQKNETHKARTKASQFNLDRWDERTKQIR